ncbi:glutamyl-tRNA amidotransferase [Burkholderia lata]|uniref:DUF1120 domain-containing protein n=1 Tax=Burkholderia lata (strain ATCC 17760 / DSM 23089 / LMG 22485 / NCIMB 9086 / R18194 / 383) TaxID=482957 RepID=UPI001452E81D|nr:DUF1120 domain-containing protein [Burkholderia lata]VWD54575.1 glutamyl-tRNA amidotransferase [Burkholderia lata]
MKFHQFIAPAAALALLGVTGSAMAQQTSATIEVRGEITPPACNIGFDGNGELTFTRAFNALDAGGTKLESQNIGMNVSCEAPTRVAVKLTDAKAASKIAYSDVLSSAWVDVTAASNWSGSIFGLGTTPDGENNPQKIGGFMIQVPSGDATVDNQPGKMAGLQANDTLYYSGQPFRDSTLATENDGIRNGYTFYTGGWRSSGTVPVAFETASTTLTVTPTIAKPANLPAGDEIQLDGQVNFELRYL